MRHIFDEVGGYQLAWGVFDAMPLVLLLLDEERRVHAVNEAAEAFLGTEDADPLRQRFGEVVHCVHADDHPSGCGYGPACATCDVRTSHERAIGGERIERHEVRITRRNADGADEELAVLLAASPVELGRHRLAVMTVETLGVVHNLRSLLPVCGKCGKVDEASGDWGPVSAYLAAHPEAGGGLYRCERCRTGN